MILCRMTPLPVATCRGRLIVVEDVTHATRVALQGFRGDDGRHEGIVFWLGRRVGEDALVVGAYVPRAIHGPQSVHVCAEEVGQLGRYARRWGMTLVAQVHSHPGNDTHHSDGDDHLILMPHEKMFSLVIAQYGHGSILPAEGCGVHQFQDGHWVYISNAVQAVLVPPVVGYPPK